MSSSAPLRADRDQVHRFVALLFRYADTDTYVSLRSFDQFRDMPPTLIRSVQINGSLDPVVHAACRAATAAASDPPQVFAPVLCTLANGLSLSIELDQGDTVTAQRRLEGILGPATCAVASGGECADAATGEVFPKLHLHWRLSEPTRQFDEHGMLRQARDMATRLAGGDPTGKPVVHCYRWPGSWNRKTNPPRMACIVAECERAEIHLVEAFDRLTDAIEAEGFAAAGAGVSATPDDPSGDYASAMSAIPNHYDDVHYDDWIRLGYACWRASGGSDDGFDAWDTWSRKSQKYNAGDQEAAWGRIGKAIAGSSAPRTIGAGTIFYLAAQAGWKRPINHEAREPPPREPPGPGLPEPEPERELRSSVGADCSAVGPLVLSPSSPLNSARALVLRTFQLPPGRTLQHQQDTFYRWCGTRYVESAKEEMRATVYDFLDGAKRVVNKQRVPFAPNKSKVANVLEAIAAVAQLPASTMPPAWLDRKAHPPAIEFLPCANGLLHLPTRVLSPATPAFFGLNAVNYPYEADAPAPEQWINFLHTLWPDDKASIATLQEEFGLLLTPDTSQQKIVLLVGPPRSGKGTIARMASEMVGTENVAGPTLHSLTQNFGLAPLIGKPLAIISDARLSGRSDASIVVERLLAISGEGTLSIPRKFCVDWTGQLPTRFIILTNELPRLADASGALASRFIILVMTRSFYGKEDRSLVGKLLKELPGILKWAMEGRDRLAKRGYFVQPVSAQQAVDELADLASPIGAFVRDRCNVGPQYAARADALYGTWVTWCRQQHRDRPGTTQTFGRDLRAAVPGITITQPRDAKTSKQVRQYQGIGLKL